MKESHQPNNCGTVRDMLADYSADNVGWIAARRIRTHLSNCADCSRELDLLLSVTQMVEEVGHREPPAGLWHGVHNRISAGNESTTAHVNRRTGWMRRRAISLAGGLAVILLALSLMMNQALKPHFTNTHDIDVIAQEYVEAHAFLAQEQPFADKFSLALVAAGGGAGNVEDAKL